MRNMIERTCPWCNKKFKNHFTSHILNEHGKTWNDYTLEITGLSDIPTCELPGCTNKVYSDPHQHRMGFTHYCCNAHAQKHKALLGKSPLQKQNWGKYDIYNKMMEAKKQTFGSSSNSHKTGTLTLYAGLFRKENSFKIGTTKDFYNRSRVFKSRNIVFDEMITLQGPAEKIAPLERELMISLKDYWKPLDKNRYPYDKSNGYSVGNSEWFSEEAWDIVKCKFKEIESSTTIDGGTII